MPASPLMEEIKEHGQAPTAAAAGRVGAGRGAVAGSRSPGRIDEVKLCGLDLARTIIRNCGKIHWRRSDSLAQEAMGDAFPDTDPYADSQLEEAVGSSDWLVLTKPPQALYGSLRGTRENPSGDSLLNRCCNKGCTKRELTIFCY
ncbi:hypothetical protein QTO34_015424 [Cnephaeus nilssonii]|uniref:Insulin-like domain-containing protein n=1 Tax=Cnephaeus nilssonii TaxID=3371016 RepID=A0AA40LST5_CNENI|nr:hypothetical protein QTO34_015424 [Eptesicus nilssonii]